jgi:hypothetical protein
MAVKNTENRRPWAVLLEELCRARNESYRRASLAAGLDHGAVHRFVRGNCRPHRESCIALAHHFGLNPNEMLVAAGHEPLPWFDPSLVNASDYPFEVKQVAETLMRISSPRLRREICEALQTLTAAASAGLERLDRATDQPFTANSRSKGGIGS